MANAGHTDDIAALLRKDAIDRESMVYGDQLTQLEKDSKNIMEMVQFYTKQRTWPWGQGVVMVSLPSLGKSHTVSTETRLCNLRNRFPETSFELTEIYDSMLDDEKNVVSAVRISLRTSQ